MVEVIPSSTALAAGQTVTEPWHATDEEHACQLATQVVPLVGSGTRDLPARTW
jgi:hypothetical protein